MDLHVLAQTGLWNDTSNRTINGSSKHETDRDMSGGLGNGDNALRRHLSRHESESAAWSRKQASKREHGIASVQRPATTRTQSPVSSKLLAFKTTKIERTQLRCTDTLDHWNGAEPGDATEL